MSTLALYIDYRFLLSVIMANLFSKLRGSQGVEECEEMAQATEVEIQHAQKKKDVTREPMRRYRA
jgi:hypothetical protein